MKAQRAEIETADPKRRRAAGLLLSLLLAAAGSALEAQDVVRVASRSAAAGEVLEVPLSVLDRAGTPLDADAGPRRAIAGLAVTVEPFPASAVAGLEIVRAGLTADLAPRFETQVQAGPRHSWIASFSQPVPFTGGAETVAHLRLRIAPGTAEGTVIALRLVAETTALSNVSGTLLERQQNGGLELVDGAVEVTAAPCTTDTTLCLLDDRFEIEIEWTDFQGATGRGTPVKLTDETGYFWFFGPANVEVVIKTLDGRGVNGNFWVFYGALSNVGYEITVTDSVSGLVKRYSNPAGRFASVGDIQAFPDPGGGATAEAARKTGAGLRSGVPLLRLGKNRAGEVHQGGCTPSDTELCLLDDRFRLEMTWEDFQGNTGVGRAVALSDETGYFWFFGPDNVELIVKTLDGRAINGHFWVFYGALSNVRFSLLVTDTETGDAATYVNPLGSFASVGDIGAF